MMTKAKKEKKFWFFSVLKLMILLYERSIVWALCVICGSALFSVYELRIMMNYSDLLNILAESHITALAYSWVSEEVKRLMNYSDWFNIFQDGRGMSLAFQYAIAVLLLIFWYKILNRLIFASVHEWGLVKLKISIQQTIYSLIFFEIHKHSHQYFIDNSSEKILSQTRRMIRALEEFTDRMVDFHIFFYSISCMLLIISMESIRIALGILLFIIFFFLIQYRVIEWFKKYQDRTDRLEDDLMECLSDTIALKPLSTFQRENQCFAERNNALSKSRTKQYLLLYLIRMLSLVVGVFLETIVVRYGITLWGRWELDIGTIVLVQIYVFRILNLIVKFGWSIKSCASAANEIGEWLKMIQTPQIKDVESAPSLRINEAKIRFQNVDFSYQDEQLFQDLNFEIKPGEHVALVWASGSGKSTITKLLFRFYDIQKGKILIDDQDISQVTQESLRTHLSLVPQDPILFHRSIRENIAYARPDASDDEIKAAAKMARCDLFIDHLEDKYETLVGERGIKLSWGERQRIAIARAIIENAPILIMDEATSALDSESEKYIQEAMAEVMKNKTSIVIAHRLSTIMKMDRIIVMDQWKIVEVWTHSELIQKSDGIYKKLRDIRSGGFIK